MTFEIRRSKAIQKSKLGEYFYFVLVANNGQDLVTSEMYESKQSAQKGIMAVRKCLFAKVVDKSTYLTI